MSSGTSKEVHKGFPTKADVMAQTPDPAVRRMLVRMETLGFARIDRASAPPEIQDSRQFASLCPASATLMHRRLPSPA